MKRFTELYRQLDASTSTEHKVHALTQYFGTVPAHDAAWAAYFLAGGKLAQVVPTSLLRTMACRQAKIPEWLFEECYANTGDLAEAISYVLPPATREADLGLTEWISSQILSLRGRETSEQQQAVQSAWDQLDAEQRFIYIKLIGGGFRVGVSKLLVQRALALAFGIDAKVVAQRMMGFTDRKQLAPVAQFVSIIDTAVTTKQNPGQPYPFFLAHALEGGPEVLGSLEEWLVEWKYDGIRAQLIRRDNQTWIWTRGEELVSDRYPEILSAAQMLPDGTVLDGEILAWLPGAAQPAPFALLQRRIGRLTMSKKILAEAPVRFIAYDLLEHTGADCRGQAQHERRRALEQIFTLKVPPAISCSPLVTATSWPQLTQTRQESRSRGVEGLMLKSVQARYGSGRTRSDGVWLKWKVDPLSVDCILIYAQAGHGRRANVFTDYTFALWSRAPVDEAEANACIEAIANRLPAPSDLQLVSFAKAYSGLTDLEFRRIDQIVRKTTLEKFGPVRTVKPSLVFELGFEGISASARHKSGFATRFPRMLRIRDDKPLWQADSIATLTALLRSSAPE